MEQLKRKKDDSSSEEAKGKSRGVGVGTVWSMNSFRTGKVPGL